MNTYIAKGSSGGGRSSGGSRSSSSSSKSSAPKSSTSTPKTSTPKPTTPKTSTKPGTSKSTPGSKIKTASGAEAQSSAKKPSNSKFTRSTGIVGDNGYTPRFTNGYSAPAGSVVYYPQHSALDYLPWIYLFNSNNSPRNDHATVVQPDNKEVVVKPEKGGVDGLYILNWFLLIAVVIALISGIVFGVNKLSKRNSK